MDTETTQEEQRSAPTLSYPQSVSRLEEIHTRMEEIGSLTKPTEENDDEFHELSRKFQELDTHRRNLERAAELAAVRSAASSLPAQRRMRLDVGSASPGRGDYDRDAILEPDSVEDCRFRNPFDLSEIRTYGRPMSEVSAEYRARALSGIEKVKGTSDNVRQAMASIIERFDDHKSTLARQFLATSSPAYMRAWSKMATNRQHALAQDEIRAIEQVRAMSLTDNAGGYLVPFQLDPTVIITSDGVRNDIRQAARQVVATSDVWHGVSSTAVSWSWDAEATQVSDDSTTFAGPAITNHKAQGFVPISIEALMDEQNVTSEVGRLLAAGKNDLEAAAFITGLGDGQNQPVGIVTALTGTSSVVTAAADDTFSIGDIYTLQGSLPARSRPQASWLANNLIYNLIRQFDQYGGGGFWVNLLGDRPPQLLGRTALEAEAMDGTVTTGSTTANYVLIFGDFSNYVITDRIGMQVEFLPHLFGANQRPIGQRGWYAYYRTGADSVNDGGFRMLNVASADSS